MQYPVLPDPLFSLSDLVNNFRQILCSIDQYRILNKCPRLVLGILESITLCIGLAVLCTVMLDWRG